MYGAESPIGREQKCSRLWPIRLRRHHGWGNGGGATDGETDAGYLLYLSPSRDRGAV